MLELVVNDPAPQGLFSRNMNRIRYLLDHYRLPVWGFVVYRTFDGHDERFLRLLTELKQRIIDAAATYGLKERDRQIIAKFSLDIVHDRRLIGASTHQVRLRHQHWLDNFARLEWPIGITHAEIEMLKMDNPRYAYCIQIDEEAIQYYTRDITYNAMTYVKIIRANSAWNAWNFPEFTTYEYPDPNQAAHSQDISETIEEADAMQTVPAFSPLDENQVEIEGCRLYDVGWMNWSAFCLLSDLYVRLGTPKGWYDLYRRPNVGIAPAL